MDVYPQILLQVELKKWCKEQHKLMISFENFAKQNCDAEKEFG